MQFYRMFCVNGRLVRGIPTSLRSYTSFQRKEFPTNFDCHLFTRLKRELCCLVSLCQQLIIYIMGEDCDKIKEKYDDCFNGWYQDYARDKVWGLVKCQKR